jgi:hypothetical protein
MPEKNPKLSALIVDALAARKIDEFKATELRDDVARGKWSFETARTYLATLHPGTLATAARDIARSGMVH